MAEVSRKVLGWRMRAMPYLYTAFYDSHVFGCPIARPLWFSFPSDSTTLHLQEQWMMGEHFWQTRAACPASLTCLMPPEVLQRKDRDLLV